MPFVKDKSVITLLTDFGQKDGYVGMMKGVIAGIHQNVNIIDLSHDVTPGEIHTAAFILSQSYSYFPKNSIHVVIVDPGVGSSRRALAVKTKNYYFIAPDNGVLKYIYEKESFIQVISLTNNRYFLNNKSHTFHGRDIFAPVAAHLSLGIPLSKLGPVITDYENPGIAAPVMKGSVLYGEIIHVDRFGNLITNIPGSEITNLDMQEIIFKNVKIEQLSHSYSQVEVNKPLAIIGSHGNIEISLRNASAALSFNSQLGDSVKVIFKETRLK